jgi:hypothetical protein
MKLSCWPIVLLMIAILAPGARELASAQERSHVGWVEEFSGPAYLIRKGSKVKEQFKPDRDRYRFLYPGDSVGCDEGGTLKITLFGKLKTISPSPNPTPIPSPPAAPADVNQKAMDDYGRTGGRPRGTGQPASPIFSPTKNSGVRPQSFVIRWIPVPGAQAVSFSLQDEDGKEIWHLPHAAGISGTLLSDPAKKALQQYRDEGGSGTLVLTLQANEKKWQVSFQVISAESEQSLAKELAAAEREESPLMRYVLRAYAFNRRMMFNDAAIEYDTALSLAPKSTDLIIADIQAQRRIGNTTREEELIALLPPGTKPPE